MLCRFFVLDPIYAQPECGKAFCTGTLATQANERTKKNSRTTRYARLNEYLTIIRRRRSEYSLGLRRIIVLV